MPIFNIGFIPYADMTQDSGNALTTTAITGAFGGFSVDPGIAPSVIEVDDDDNVFHDGITDPGAPQTLAVATTVNGQSFAAGSVVELEFAVTATTGERFYYIRIAGQNVGITGPVLPQPGVSYVIQPGSSAALEDDLYDNIPCFTAGTAVETATGLRNVETIMPGDLVLTGDNGLQPVRWTGRRDLFVRELRDHPHLAPVEFAPGALGNPRTLRVSPQHRTLISGWRVELLYGEPSVLVPAKALINGTTIRQPRPDDAVSYVHLMFDTHQVIKAGGVLSESFHPGDQGLHGLPAATRAELLALFPELADPHRAAYRTAYPVVARRAGALLAA